MQKLHSQLFGQGKPLLVLHGFLGMSDNWKTLGIKFAEQGYQVHLIDQRNHGQSFHSDAFSYELLSADIKKYISENNLQNVSIIGHSMGGKTAMLLATQFPNLIEKLVVVDIAPKYYPVHHQQIINALQSVDFQKITSRKEVEEVLSHSISDMGTRQFLLKNVYWQTKEKLGFRFHLSALAKNIVEIGKALPENAFFNEKTLFIRGEKSNYITDSDFSDIKKHFPNSEIITIKNAGHWVQAENPIDFFSETLSFLKN